MRHRKGFRKLNRVATTRKAMLASQVKTLIEHGKVDTTIARAKESQRLAERMVTLAKQDTVHTRRRAFRIINNGELLERLFGELGPRYLDRPGGYTRVLKLGSRKGDGAEMARLMWVEE
jgi:large subunit ribosomal protein L17